MTQLINWDKEAENLNQQREWFKATPGEHKIKFKSDGEKYTVEWDEKTIDKVRFDMVTGGKKFSWGVPIGKTYRSLYGQISLIAQDNGNKLEDVEITLLVKGSGKDVDYTIIEAVGLIPTEQPKEEQVS